MPEQKNYHHGDLRAALLDAAESVLSETGIEGFSLRRVAREVGVSHSAPAHHFGDAKGLLEALATEGFRRFLTSMKTRQAALRSSEDPRELLLASGLGYLDFAETSPTLFRLMFGSGREPGGSEELKASAMAAFDHLANDIARIRGKSHVGDIEGTADVMAAWSMVHGFSELMISGRMPPVREMPPKTREAFFRTVFSRVAP